MVIRITIIMIIIIITPMIYKLSITAVTELIPNGCAARRSCTGKLLISLLQGPWESSYITLTCGRS